MTVFNFIDNIQQSNNRSFQGENTMLQTIISPNPNLNPSNMPCKSVLIDFNAIPCPIVIRLIDQKDEVDQEDEPEHTSWGQYIYPRGSALRHFNFIEQDACHNKN